MLGWRGAEARSVARGRIGIGETSLEGATESGLVYESTHNGLALGWGDVVLSLTPA